MIITRTPFRISFAGGGSDLQSFYGQEPGAVLSTAIDKFIYLAVKPHFEKNFRVSYSRTEIVNSRHEIEHPIVRECLEKLEVERGIELVSMADLPAHSGMGSSSSFTVGLLHALYAMNGKAVTADRLAREACEIEIERLKEPIGKQDQYIAAYGGLQFIEFHPGGEVLVDPVVCPAGTREELNRRLVLFFTGITRRASEVLTDQNARSEVNRPVLRKMCQIARELREVLVSGRDLNRFGGLLHEAWEAKRSLTGKMSNGHIDDLYRRGLEAGALGGKLLGAGGGGFLLFYCEPHKQQFLTEALAGAEPLPFRLEMQGSKIVYVGTDY
jgi:D-glycero-alpha-D-manno-heptose-7-phosphate kinase